MSKRKWCAFIWDADGKAGCRYGNRCRDAHHAWELMPDSAPSTAASSNQCPNPTHRPADVARAVGDVRMRDPSPPPCYFFPSRDFIIATKWYDISLGIATRAAGKLAIALTWYVFSFRLAEVGLALRAWLLNGSRAPPQLMSGEPQHGQIPQQDHSTRIALKWF